MENRIGSFNREKSPILVHEENLFIIPSPSLPKKPNRQSSWVAGFEPEQMILHNQCDEDSPAGAKDPGEDNDETTVGHQDDGQDHDDVHGCGGCGGGGCGDGRAVFQDRLAFIRVVCVISRVDEFKCKLN